MGGCLGVKEFQIRREFIRRWRIHSAISSLKARIFNVGEDKLFGLPSYVSTCLFWSIYISLSFLFPSCFNITIFSHIPSLPTPRSSSRNRGMTRLARRAIRSASHGCNTLKPRAPHPCISHPMPRRRHTTMASTPHSPRLSFPASPTKARGNFG